MRTNRTLQMASELVVGARVLVEKNLSGCFSHTKGEILAVKQVNNGDSMYYIHYLEFNKRLDEWVHPSKFDLAQVEPPSKLCKKRPSSADQVKTSSPKTLRLEETPVKPEEVTRVKNISCIELGMYRVDTWYFSPYPQCLLDGTVLYICETCLEPHPDRTSLKRHRIKCGLAVPPGTEIYRQGNMSLFEVDGHRQKAWCRNLCLLSKLFLDHKTLYYDVDPFLFYVLTCSDEFGAHIVGYFSKEKVSSENYNVACILTLPQHQRKGYGKLLIGLSYELSKLQGIVGTPEKPLSDLGLLSYRSYWTEEILRVLAQARDISISELSLQTSITCEDIVHTLQAIDLLTYHQGQYAILLSDKAIQDYKQAMNRSGFKLDPRKIQWTPPLFSAQELKYI